MFLLLIIQTLSFHNIAISFFDYTKDQFSYSLESGPWVPPPTVIWTPHILMAHIVMKMIAPTIKVQTN
jgi:hypothetical protein